MRKVGFISEVKPEDGTARVEFREDGITSDWLSVIVPGSLNNKYSFPYEVNEQVVCLMDEHCEQGEIVGARYNKSDKPGEYGSTVTAVKYKDGSVVKYDSQVHEFTMTIGQSEFVINEAGGFRIKKGGETLYAILNDLITQLTTETHTGNLGFPTTPPINSPAYSAIMTRLQTLLIP